ncbi:hypothetical protein B0H14DRAFT_2616442 [Mycena olivaceomarginata]|nr:hypothetical protein B0H14DRAFT_2616442 [Mycena olivaceomarginata]
MSQLALRVKRSSRGPTRLVFLLVMVSSPRVRLKQVHRAGNNREEHIFAAMREGTSEATLARPRWTIPLCGGTPSHWTLVWVDYAAYEIGIFYSIRSLDQLAGGSPYSYSQWTLYESILAHPKLHGIRTRGVVGSYHLPSLSVSLTVRHVDCLLGWALDGPQGEGRTVTAHWTGRLSQVPGKVSCSNSCLSQYLRSRAFESSQSGLSDLTQFAGVTIKFEDLDVPAVSRKPHLRMARSRSVSGPIYSKPSGSGKAESRR